MKVLKHFLPILLIGILTWACSPKLNNNTNQKEKPVRIANDSLEYEVIIIDLGFNAYLNSTARPIDYYSQAYLKNWNRIYVTNWNFRFRNPTLYNQDIYQNLIDYQFDIDYGLEVDYKLFNYFQFAQIKYKINLENGTNSPTRIR